METMRAGTATDYTRGEPREPPITPRTPEYTRREPREPSTVDGSQDREPRTVIPGDDGRNPRSGRYQGDSNRLGLPGDARLRGQPGCRQLGRHGWPDPQPAFRPDRDDDLRPRPQVA